MKTILQAQNVSFFYPQKRIFSNISFSLEEGTFTVVLSSMGGGKSTLARIIAGLEPCDGSLIFSDLPYDAKNLPQIRKWISFISENPNSQFINKSVRDELKYMIKTQGMKNIEEKMDSYAKKLNITNLLEKPFHTLSSGEKQIVRNYHRQKIFSLLKEEVKLGLSVLYFTSSVEDILYGKHLLVIHNQEILFDGTVNESLKNEKLFKSISLELPFMANLSNILSYYGKLSKLEMDKKRLVDQLWK